MNIQLTVIFTIQAPDVTENDIEDLALELSTDNCELLRLTGGGEPAVERAKFLEFETVDSVAVV